MKSITTIVLLACLYTPIAWSQCSTGVDTGGGGCVPPDAPGMPGYQGNANQQQQAPQPQAVWADRWGAIAVDNNTGQAGTIEGQESESKANQIALAYCRQNGSKNCQIILSFHNQCAAVALGGGGAGHAGSPTQQAAEQIAITECGHGDACKIVYSKCSYAERIR